MADMNESGAGPAGATGSAGLERDPDSGILPLLVAWLLGPASVGAHEAFLEFRPDTIDMVLFPASLILLATLQATSLLVTLLLLVLDTARSVASWLLALYWISLIISMVAVFGDPRGVLAPLMPASLWTVRAMIPAIPIAAIVKRVRFSSRRRRPS